MSTLSKTRMDQLIPLAISVIKEVWKNEMLKENGKVSKTYHGYFSSFGADMINSTPLAAIIFCEEAKMANESGASGSKEDRSKITKSILFLLRKELGTGPGGVADEWISLSDFYMKSHFDTKKKIELIIGAAAALKIALRTFPKSS